LSSSLSLWGPRPSTSFVDGDGVPRQVWPLFTPPLAPLPMPHRQVGPPFTPPLPPLPIPHRQVGPPFTPRLAPMHRAIASDAMVMTLTFVPTTVTTPVWSQPTARPPSLSLWVLTTSPITAVVSLVVIIIVALGPSRLVMPAAFVPRSGCRLHALPANRNVCVLMLFVFFRQ
jgi:hypothetical protein